MPSPNLHCPLCSYGELVYRKGSTGGLTSAYLYCSSCNFEWALLHYMPPRPRGRPAMEERHDYQTNS